MVASGVDNDGLLPRVLRALGACFDGLTTALGMALVIDAARSWFTPAGSLLEIFVALPGGRHVPGIDALVCGAALLSRHRLAAYVTGAHALLAAIGVGEYYVLLARGLPGAPIPFALASAGVFALATLRLARRPKRRMRARGEVLLGVAGAALGGVALLLGHIFSFGATDYARPAEAIVVFGARAYPDGTASLSLADRTAHGIALYHAGLAPKLVLSGAPDEVPAMHRLALEGGVPEEALELDPAGLNTHATLANLGYRRVVAVSHYYHLARIKLDGAALGLTVYTSPCPMTRRLAREPFFLVRECAAIVLYYFGRA